MNSSIEENMLNAQYLLRNENILMAYVDVVGRRLKLNSTFVHFVRPSSFKSSS
jgi:hypothetical protein